MQFSVLQNSFAAGELSPRMKTRVDSQLYRMGCRKLRNFIISPQGAAVRRPGTYYIGSSPNKVRLVPFVNSSGSYVLEFSALKIRVYKNGALIESGGSPYSIVTPYPEADLSGLQFSMVGESMWIVHRNHAPRQLARTSDTSWSLSVISFSPSGQFGSSGNYPGVICTYAGRVYLASTNTAPGTVWGSRPPDLATGSTRYTDFTTGTNPDDAILLVQEDLKGSQVRWLVPAKRLLLGTNRAEYMAVDELPSPSSFAFSPQSRVGSSSVPGIPFANGCLHIGSDSMSIGYLSFSQEAGGMVRTDLSFAAEHLFFSQVIDMDIQASPQQIVWFTMLDGSLVTLSADPQYGSFAFSAHDLGGPVESTAVLPAPSADEVWVSVRRGSVRTIERFAPLRQDILEEQHYVDCGLRISASPASKTFSGLGHLEGLTVSALGDGAPLPPQVVTGGAVSYDREISILHAGLPYESVLHTMPVVTPGPTMGHGKKKRLTKGLLSLYQSLGGRLGTSEENAEPLVYREGGAWNVPIPLYTGDIEKSLPGSVSSDPGLCVVQDSPQGMTILAIAADANVLET